MECPQPSARPILGEHSAWACQAALSSAQEIGPTGAGDHFGVRERYALSDKDLLSVVDDPVEDGVRPWGGSAILFKNNRCHPLVQSL